MKAMTQFELIVGEVAEASGTEIAIEADRVAEIAVDGTVVLVKPTDAVETSVAFFSVLVDEGVSEAQMKKALEMSLSDARRRAARLAFSWIR